MKIIRISPTTNSPEVEEIVRVYQEAFSGPPWNETWPREKVIEDFLREMAMPKPLCLAAIEAEQVVGFAWGYQVEVCPTLDGKLEAPDLHRKIEGIFFYLDECAVSPTNQAKGIGTALLQEIFRQRPDEKVLLRTMNNSRMCRLVEKLGGRTIQQLSRDRVIMVKK